MSKWIDADKLLEQRFANDISYNAFRNLVKRQPVIDLVRCGECKYLSTTTLGMPYACWHGADKIWGETGEHADHTICTRIDDLEHYCGYGERRER